MLTLLQFSPATGDWDFELNWTIRKNKGKSLSITIYKLAFTVYIYSIWRERNSRLFQQRSSPSILVAASIFSPVKLRIASLPNIKREIQGTLYNSIFRLSDVILWLVLGSHVYILCILTH